MIAYFRRNQKRILLTKSSRISQNCSTEMINSRKKVSIITVASQDTSKLYEENTQPTKNESQRISVINQENIAHGALTQIKVTVFKVSSRAFKTWLILRVLILHRTKSKTNHLLKYLRGYTAQAKFRSSIAEISEKKGNGQVILCIDEKNHVDLRQKDSNMNPVPFK